MRFTFKVEPLAVNIPGQARMRLQRWNADTNGLKFTVYGGEENGYLDGKSKKWSDNKEYWFELNALEQDSDGFYIDIGHDLLDPLLESDFNAEMTMRNSNGDQAQGSFRLSDDLLPSSARGHSQPHNASGLLVSPSVPPQPAVEVKHEPAPEPIVKPEPLIEPVVESEPEPEAAVETQPEPAQPKTDVKKKDWLKIILVVLFALVLAGVAWWLYQKKGAGLGDAVANLTTDTSACSVANMQQDNELQFIQSCLQEAKDSQALLKVIQQAKANEHCGIAQRLYANRAQSGDTVIALAYAKEYDPKYFSANSCFTEANIETAVYWYETVLLNEQGNAEAAQRLEELAL